MEELTLEKFEEASELVKDVTTETKLVYSEYFSAQTGNKVFFKPENMQYTGAYKVRGAYYKIHTLTEEEKSKGLITASAGNHAQGVAYAAKLAGVKATVVMPTTTPLMKVNRTKSYGADVVLEGTCSMRPAITPISWRRSSDIPLYILSTTWTWLRDRAPLPWKSSRSFPRWTISWFPSAEAVSVPAFPHWPSF